MSNLTQRELALRARLRSDLEVFAPACLWIRPKVGKPIRFSFNRAQRYIHARLEEQRARFGRVRALILKGRQQGCSTYVGARFYHKVVHGRGLRCFILTHEDQATQNLFEMVQRYHDNVPELVRPSTGAANAKELYFDALDAGYKVATAGTKGVGRSSTNQLFHGSEVAFWPHAATHAAGVLQSVPNEAGTEVILESTANGVGGLFHERWQEAERGEGDYVAIFVPWFWQDEYSVPAPADFALRHDLDEQGESEASYAAAHGLSLGQMAWRREKIRELGGDLNLFRQEYPATAAEAFQMSGHDSFIKPALIVKARKHHVEDALAPLVIGFDPAHTGGDRHAMAWRRGRKLLKVEGKVGLDTLQSWGWLLSVINSDKPAKVFLDATGIGAAIYDQAKDQGFCNAGGRNIVVPVNFGAPAIAPVVMDPTTGQPLPGPLNRRAEIWWASRDWLEDPVGVDIPDLDALQVDACGPGYDYDLRSRLRLESKPDMRSRGVKSPDFWDAVALTFAQPVIDLPVVSASSMAPRRGWMGS